jgi:preprotein translocase subunit SecB
LPPPDLAAVLNVACPRVLLPFAREAVASALGRSGFAPVLLPHVDFEHVYRQRLQEAQQQADARPAA